MSGRVAVGMERRECCVVSCKQNDRQRQSPKSADSAEVVSDLCQERGEDVELWDVFHDGDM
jgi:hypothetical protein